jgi:flagellar biosynthesis regulator FlaF
MSMERRIATLERRHPPRWARRIALIDVTNLDEREARRAVAAAQATQPLWRPGDAIRAIVVVPCCCGDEDGAA